MTHDVQAPSTDQDVQSLCEAGQQHLIRTEYRQAERVLAAAEAKAYASRDWDTLARVYMPLQEARRQRRQLSGEGVVDLRTHISRDAREGLDPAAIFRATDHGQLLVAGWGTLEPALNLRQMVDEALPIYLDVFLAAAYAINGGGIGVLIVPHEHVTLPPPTEYSPDQLIHCAPPHSILLPIESLPAPQQLGDTKSFAYTMDLFEQLHRPFLALADAAQDLEQKIALYRQTIEVDYAAEFAHQRLSNAARELARRTKTAS